MAPTSRTLPSLSSLSSLSYFQIPFFSFPPKTHTTSRCLCLRAMSIRRDGRLLESLPKELLFEERALRRYVQEINEEELRTSIEYHLTSLLEKYMKLNFDLHEELHQVRTQLEIYSTKYDDLVASMAIPGTNPFAYPNRAPLSPPISTKPDTIDYPYVNKTDGHRGDVNSEVLLQDIIDQLTVGSPRQASVSKGQANDYFDASTAQVQNPANLPAENSPRIPPSLPPSEPQEQEPPPNFPASILAAHPQPASATPQRPSLVSSSAGSQSGRSQEDRKSLSSDSTLSKHSSLGYEKPATFQGNERLAQQPPASPVANMPDTMATLMGPPGRRISYYSIPESFKSDNSWHRGSWASEDSGRSNIQMALDDTNSTISGYSGNRQQQHPGYYNNSMQIQPPRSSELYAFPNLSYTMAAQQRLTEDRTSLSSSPSLERQQGERQMSITKSPQPVPRQLSSPSLERLVLSRQYTPSQVPQSPQLSSTTLERQQTRAASQDSQGSQTSSQATSNHSQTPLTPILGSRTLNIPPPTPTNGRQPDNPTSGSHTDSVTSPSSTGFSPLTRSATIRSVGSIASTAIDLQFSTSNPQIYHNRRSQPLELGGTNTLWTTLDGRSNSGEELSVKFVNSYIKDCSPNIAKPTPNEGTLLYGYGLIHAAIILKSISLLAVLLQAGANPDALSLCALDDDKVTPLYLAAKLEWVDGLNLLVQYGADVRNALGAGKSKKTAFTIAAELGKIESLRALIIASQQGGWVNVPDGNQITPLHWACW